MKVADLYTDSSRWTKGAYERNAAGEPIRFQKEGAVCWCLVGAMQQCYLTEGSYGARMRAVAAHVGCYDLTAWNDAPERTFAEVRALVEELDL